jgi:hypothetical protein
MEASRKTKIPLKPKLGYTPTKGTMGNCLRSSIRRMPDDRTLRSLDASLAITAHVLRLEASDTLWPQTGQTGSPNRSGRFSKPVRLDLARQPRPVFGLGFVAQPGNPIVFWWTTANPANLMQPLPITTHDSAPTKSRLDLGFVPQPRNFPRLHLTVLATMRPPKDKKCKATWLLG